MKCGLGSTSYPGSPKTSQRGWVEGRERGVAGRERDVLSEDTLLRVMQCRLRMCEIHIGMYDMGMSPFLFPFIQTRSLTLGYSHAHAHAMPVDIHTSVHTTLTGPEAAQDAPDTASAERELVSDPSSGWG